jgi:hypothetical protein
MSTALRELEPRVDWSVLLRSERLIGTMGEGLSAGQRRLFPTPGAAPAADLADAGDELSRATTLGDVFAVVWHDLMATGTASCPTCGGQMTRLADGGGDGVDGWCADCGSVLS